MNGSRSQPIPRIGPAREALQQKGQFWTPDWVADAMVAYALADGAAELFDPAVGAGAFFRAAKRWSLHAGRPIQLRGTEVDAAALAEARRRGSTEADLQHVSLRDFVLQPPPRTFAAIVANPPYIRHHRLPTETKARLRCWSRLLLGFKIDGRAGLHVYILLRCLERLAVGGRLAFIVSADVCEGVFARGLWEWIGRRFQIEGVVTFEASAAPFPQIDTNAILFLIRNVPPQRELVWARCLAAEPEVLSAWTVAPRDVSPDPGALVVWRRSVEEALATGLSRPPSQQARSRYRLGDFASVMRGIVTGDNEFFFLTRSRAASLGIPPSCLIPAIGRTRDVAGDELTAEHLADLDRQGRPTLLLSVGNRPLNDLPEPVRRYLKHGEALGLPDKPLIAARRPWYRVETRRIPPFLFAYLGRRHARFIRNRAGVVPLTCLLCVYPFDESPPAIERLWQVLRDPAAVANLRLVGKSYGSDAIKVEPRALEQLPLPEEVVEAAGLVSVMPPRPLELALD